MNLLKLKLKNFRVYHDEQIIEFSNLPDKNVTIVHGENSMGKTTMLNAIKFCLYSKTPDWSGTGTPKKLLNRITNAIGDTKKFSVEIEFEENDTIYIATREAIQNEHLGTVFEGNDKGLTLLKEEKSGAVKSLSNPQSIINSILPEELSDYFLFAGETYQTNKTSADTRSMYKKAVRDILGFTTSELAITDLDEIKKKNKAKLNALHRQDTNTALLTSQIEKLDGEVKTLSEESESLGIAKKNHEKRIAEYEKQILESNHYQAKDLQQQLNDKERTRNTQEKNLVGFEIQKQALISKFGFAVFGMSLVDKMDWLALDENQNRIPGEYYDTFIHGLLEAEECICHEPLIKGSDKYKAVESKLEDANTSSSQDKVRKALSFLDRFEGRSEEFLEEVVRIGENLKNTRELITSYQVAIDDLDTKLRALNRKDITNILNKKKEEQRKKSEVESKKARKDVLIADKNRQIKTKENERKKFAGDSSEVELRNKIEAVIQQVQLRILHKQSITEKAAREEIQKHVQSNIDACLRKQFDVMLDEDYNLKSIYRGDETMQTADEEGMGQTLLTNLSFFSALISYSKNRLTKKKNTYLFGTGTVAPFVIDAPFAQMDKKYQKSTLNFLPTQSHQLILFLSTGQWRESYEKIIGDKIGKRYYLLNHLPKDKTPEEGEDDKLSIKGKKYTLNVNDGVSDIFPHTTVEEIKI